ncbi:MAG: DUF4476 domain-containing protein [Thermoflavifilum sp.]|nr:DUF4476 domain-containing protein [Thermoflavifilum sp.]
MKLMREDMCRSIHRLWFMGSSILWMLLAGLEAFAQAGQHFVYIQGDQHQMFYVKLNDQIISANPPGYVVLSPVKSGKLELVIGFPRNAYPEQRFEIPIPAGQDKGYLLKRIGDREFALYDLHQYTEIKPVAIAEGQGFAYPITARGADTNRPKQMLIKSPGPIKDTTPEAETQRFRQLLMAAATAGQPGESMSVAHAQPQAANEERVADSALSARMQQFYPADTEQQASQPMTAKALFPSTNQEQADTILAHVHQPAANTFPQEQAIDQVPTPAVDTSFAHALQKLQQLAEQVPVRAPDTEATEPSTASAPVFTSAQTANSTSTSNPPLQFIHFDTTSNSSSARQHITMINSDCVHVLNDEQFDMLKKKVAAQRSDTAMLRVVQRNLKNNCFTTSQVEIMVYLFTTESYRYRFIEWVYPHVADSDHFKQLKHIFSDPENQARFQSLIRQ